MSKDIRIQVIADTTGFAKGMAKAEESTKSLSGHITGLKSSVLGLAKSYGALVGVVAGGAAVEKAITDWEDLAKAHRQMVAQLEANKEAVAAVLPWVEKLDQRFEKLGFTNAQTQEAFTRLDRAAGSAAVAYRYMGVAADLARTRHISFGQSALLIGKIVQGNVAALNRFGIIIPKGTSALDALTLVQKKLAGQAAAGVTPMERLRAVITDLSAKLGGVAVEAFTKYITQLADWLDKSRNQKKLLDQIHQGVKLVSQVVTDLIGVIKASAPWMQMIAEKLGGWKKVIEALILLKIATVIAAWGKAAVITAGQLGLIGPAAAKSEAMVVGSAATGSAALDAEAASATAATGAIRGIGIVAAGVIPILSKLASFGIGGFPDQVHGTKTLNKFLAGNGKQVAPGVYQIGSKYYAVVNGKTQAFTSIQAAVAAMGGVSSSAGVGYPLPSKGKLVGTPGQGTHSRTAGSGPGGYLWEDDDAVDITMKPGERVLAAEDGVIDSDLRYGGKSGRYSGWGFRLLADSGAQYYYKHLSHVTIAIGDQVKQGQVLGYGTTTGHLHFAKKGAQTASAVLATAGIPAVPAMPATGAPTGPPGSQSLPPSGSTSKKKPAKPKKGKAGKAKSTYSYSQLKSLWLAAGGPAHVADIAAAIAVAESGGRSWVMNKNGNGSIDYGCWQINSVHRYDPASLIDGDQSYNAECAVAIYSSSGFGAWTTYNSGAFQQFLSGKNSPKSSGAAFSSPTQDIAAAQAAKAAQQAAARHKQIAHRSNVGQLTGTPGFGGGPGPIFTGDQLLPAGLRNQLAQLQAKFNADTMMAGLLTGTAATKMQAAMQANLTAQAQDMADEVTHLQNLLKSAHGKQRTAILDELNKVKGALTAVNDQILSSLQGMVSAAQTNVSNIFQTLKGKIDAAFEAQTQRMVDALGTQFFQGGLTPAEQALKQYQDAQTQKGLQDALAAAQTPEEIKAAQDAITLDRLQAAATAERTAADKAYSEAVTKLQAERQAQEQALNDQLDKMLESVLNGTGTFDDLATVAAEWGVSISKDLIPTVGDLTSAAMDLAKAFADLIAFIDKITGRVGPSQGNPTTGPGGDSVWTQPGWWHPGLATGQPGKPSAYMVRARAGGTLVRLGEGRHSELVTPLNGMPMGGVTVNLNIQHLFGTDRETARKLANMIEPELARQVGFRRT